MNDQKTLIAKTFFVVFAAAAVFVFGFRAPAAHADECGVTTADIAQIKAVQNDPTLDYSDETKQVLVLRKEFLTQTIGCAEQDVQALQGNLASTTVESGDTLLQSQLSGRLDEATDFYNGELTKLAGVGVTGSEDIAQELLAWRTSTFAPLSENVNDFILWENNQNLFDTAAIRMAQTQRAVAFLESANSDPTLQAALSSAESSFSTAQAENAAARNALGQNLPDQSLSLIKQSLSSLSDTYQSFSTISALISSNLIPQ
jgi:hypothetical protein